MKIIENCDLSNYNSYKIKSVCKKAYFPQSINDILKIYRDSANSKIILGGGYNVIFSKSYYEKEFILLGESFSSISLHGDLIEVESGADMKNLSEYALSKNLSGLEMFYDIPSSLGGAVVMNAGASGEEIKDVIVKVQYLDLKELKIKEISKDDIGFAYRNSFFQKNPENVILKVWLKLKKGDGEEIWRKMSLIKDARWAKQPKDYPNAGSVFKRPEGHYVGTMIEDLGLKGLSVGGAQVSKKHAGFIVNFNNATGEDIIKLIKKIQQKVKCKFGVHLEVEQRII